MSDTITFSEWAALMASTEPPPRPADALTVSEWARKLGVKPETAKRRLEAGVAMGDVITATYRVRHGGGGINLWKCYQPKPTRRKA